MMRATIVSQTIDHDSLLREVTDERRGASALFLGTVRSINDGREVRAIEYSAYEDMAEREMMAVLREAESQFAGTRLVAEHRIGLLNVGDVSIAIAAAHEHRSPALDALRYAIDEIKTRAPIWKREHYVDGSEAWVDPSHAVTR
ncbi:MAG TPA: molybdenum cofactor biosynthesis protein MoaE [Gemmatimonadaceae bacterium]|nr:molybdenum cofactor biosynthesis protein MoaE [Gemmatimonadaceae bacterium]